MVVRVPTIHSTSRIENNDLRSTTDIPNPDTWNSFYSMSQDSCKPVIRNSGPAQNSFLRTHSSRSEINEFSTSQSSSPRQLMDPSLLEDAE